MTRAIRGHPQIKGKPRKPKLYLRKSYKQEMKDAIVAHANTTSVAAALNKFFPTLVNGERENTRQYIHRWVREAKCVEAGMRARVSPSKMRLRAKGSGTVLGAAEEAQLVVWVNDLRRDGVPISPALLRERALEVAADAGLSLSQFKAKRSWRVGFLARHRFSFRVKTHQGQETVADAQAKAAAFSKEVREAIVSGGIRNVINADQTAAFFELLPKTTLSPTGARTVWVRCGKSEKQRATAMVTGDIFGKKYPLFMVFKSKPATTKAKQQENNELRHGFGRLVWKEIDRFQSTHGVQIYGNQTAWWNERLTIAFLEFHFGTRTADSPPIMLLLDHFSGHWTKDVVDYAATLGIVLKKIPAGLTWRSQPADVAWIKPMKDRLRAQWVTCLRQQLARHRAEVAAHEARLAALPVPASAAPRPAPPPPPRFTMQPPRRADIVAWVLGAWGAVQTRTIMNGFKACGLFMPGTDRTPVEPTAADCCSDGTDVVDVIEQLASHGEIVGRPISCESDVVEHGEMATQEDGGDSSDNEMEVIF